ncbi:MAG: L-lactate dehydrogenase [Desulfosalsimonas sp.]
MAAGGWNKRKVVIVGAGAVGSTFAYSLAQSGLADEIALLDKSRNFAEGQVLDLVHGRPYFPTVEIYTGGPQDYADASVIVMTAGAKQASGESRLNLLKRNVAIVEESVDQMTAQSTPAVLVMVTNPVDLLTKVAWMRSGWPRSRVIGSGTVLDSSRLRYGLGQYCGVDVHNVHAYMLGEHGDSEFAAWSMTHIGGVQIEEYCAICGKCEDWNRQRSLVEENVRNSAYHIIDYKGATWFAVGLALVRIVDAILRNRRSILTVSVCLKGEYGLSDLALSLPAVISSNGVESVIEAPLNDSERHLLAHSASVIESAADELKHSQ